MPMRGILFSSLTSLFKLEIHSKDKSWPPGCIRNCGIPRFRDWVLNIHIVKGSVSPVSSLMPGCVRSGIESSLLCPKKGHSKHSRDY